MDRKKRPTSVAVIGWILILLGGLSVMMSLLTIMSGFQPLKPGGMTILGFWSLVGAAIIVVSGIAILKGLNWGRLLYLVFMPVSIVLQGLLLGFTPAHIFGLILYIVILVFLVSPAASTFFTSRNSGEPRVDE